MGKITATDEELQRLYQSHTLRQMAAMFHVGDEAIRKRLVRAGTTMRPRGGFKEFDPPRDELERLYQEKSMRQIADQYGVGETVVWKRLTEHGIKLRGHEAGGHRLKTGKKFSKEARRNMALAQRKRWDGKPENHPSWKGGRHQEHLRLRSSGAYREWKNEALELRGFKCQGCGAEQNSVCPCCGTRVRLHVHHVLSFADHPDVRFDPRNSEVLCPKCHWSRHHGKPGELRETPNVETRAILSQAAAG